MQVSVSCPRARCGQDAVLWRREGRRSPRQCVKGVWLPCGLSAGGWDRPQPAVSIRLPPSWMSCFSEPEFEGAAGQEKGPVCPGRWTRLSRQPAWGRGGAGEKARAPACAAGEQRWVYVSGGVSETRLAIEDSWPGGSTAWGVGGCVRGRAGTVWRDGVLCPASVPGMEAGQDLGRLFAVV